MEIKLKNKLLIEDLSSDTISDDSNIKKIIVKSGLIWQYDFSEIQNLFEHVHNLKEIELAHFCPAHGSYEEVLDNILLSTGITTVSFSGCLDGLDYSLLSKTSKFINLDTVRIAAFSNNIKDQTNPKLKRISIPPHIRRISLNKVDVSEGLDFSEQDLEFFELSSDLESLKTLPTEDCKQIRNINIESIINSETLNVLSEKFSNLKNVTFPNGSRLDSIDNLNNFLKVMNNTPNIFINPFEVFPKIADFFEKHPETKDSYYLTKYRLYNLKKQPSITLSIEDLTPEIIEKFKKNNFNGDITLKIQNVGELPYEKISKLQEELHIKNVSIYSKDNNIYQNYTYPIDEYTAISESLQELVEGIDDNLNEKEKFVEIYKRVATSISYDSRAAYPKSKKDEIYSEENRKNCRNLRNALLYKKAVCAGFADVLKNACSLKGIEAQYISGPIDSEIPISHLKKARYKKATVLSKNETTKKATIREYHAWNKVKLDGIWYNFDPTWDKSSFVSKELPKYAFRSDESLMNEKDRRSEIRGPACTENITKKELKYLFSNKITKKIRNFTSIVSQKILNILEDTDIKPKTKTLPPAKSSLIQDASISSGEPASPLASKSTNPWSLDNYDITVEDVKIMGNQFNPSSRNIKTKNIDIDTER